MAKLSEIKDGYAGDVLTTELEADQTTSAQSGSTYCWEKDFDVFDDTGRYERWQDLYPQVDIERCRLRAGTGRGTAPSGFFGQLQIADGNLPDALRIPNGVGGLPSVITPEEEEEDPESPYIVENAIAIIYSFEFGLNSPTGQMKSFERTVEFESLFRERDTTTGLPTGNPYTADSYSLRYEANHLVAPFFHSFTASIHPVRDVIFADLNPAKPPVDGYEWPQYRGTSLRVSGTGDHHPLRRTDATGRASQAVQSTPAAVAAAWYSSEPLGRLAYWLGGRGRTGAEQAIWKLAPKTIGRVYRWGFVPAGIGVALTGATYINSVNGYLVGTIYVTPEGGEEPARIQLVVD